MMCKHSLVLKIITRLNFNRFSYCSDVLFLSYRNWRKLHLENCELMQKKRCVLRRVSTTVV